MIERYVHHGREVAVESALKGRHREHCLCFICDRFAPGHADHCSIAAKLYALCVDESLVAPVWECPAFEIAAG